MARWCSSGRSERRQKIGVESSIMARKKKEQERPRFDWHRLFGMMLKDFFSGSPFAVETEKDLSVQKQLLDVVIIRKGKQRFAEPLPDGLDDLGAYNLVTFK